MMGIASPRILVVDDKQEHGEAIVRKLWRLGYASLFIHYDQAVLADGEYGPFQGVRLIFMDLDLISEGRLGDGSNAYAAVEATINVILDSNNGPWILVTWTGHADHADNLLSHLKERLPGELHPVSNDVMDKEQFINDDGTEKNDGLSAKLRELIPPENATGCLLGWEAGVLKSANQVVSDLNRTAISLDGANIHQKLGHILYELAKAEAGESLEDAKDYASFLYRVLASLLSDKLSVLIPDTGNSCGGSELTPVGGEEDLTGWKRKINAMVNFEANYSGNTCPGALFKITEDTEIPHPFDGNIQTLVEKEFLFPKGITDDAQKKLVTQSELYLLDITPPCDHSQKKISWRRFAFVCKVPLSVIDGMSNNQKNNLKRDYMKTSPEFRIDGQDWVFLINANLQISICDNYVSQRLGKAGGRIKEQYMADILGWIGRHITRLGHVSLSTRR